MKVVWMQIVPLQTSYLSQTGILQEESLADL